jgi:hypothetical protein
MPTEEETKPTDVAVSVEEEENKKPANLSIEVTISKVCTYLMFINFHVFQCINLNSSTETKGAIIECLIHFFLFAWVIIL